MNASFSTHILRDFANNEPIICEILQIWKKSLWSTKNILNWIKLKFDANVSAIVPRIKMKTNNCSIEEEKHQTANTLTYSKKKNK